MGFVLEGGKIYWLKSKTKGPSMPVVALHEGILRDVPLEHISYGQDPRDMVQNLQRGEYSAVFSSRPPPKRRLANVCKAGGSFPKSTYFFSQGDEGLVHALSRTAMFPTFNQFARWRTTIAHPALDGPQLPAREPARMGSQPAGAGTFVLFAAQRFLRSPSRYSYLALDAPRYHVEADGDTLTLKHRTLGGVKQEALRSATV